MAADTEVTRLRGEVTRLTTERGRLGRELTEANTAATKAKANAASLGAALSQVEIDGTDVEIAEVKATKDAAIVVAKAAKALVSTRAFEFATNTGELYAAMRRVDRRLFLLNLMCLTLAFRRRRFRAELQRQVRRGHLIRQVLHRLVVEPAERRQNAATLIAQRLPVLLKATRDRLKRRQNAAALIARRLPVLLKAARDHIAQKNSDAQNKAAEKKADEELIAQEAAQEATRLEQLPITQEAAKALPALLLKKTDDIVPDIKKKSDSAAPKAVQKAVRTSSKKGWIAVGAGAGVGIAAGGGITTAVGLALVGVAKGAAVGGVFGAVVGGTIGLAGGLFNRPTQAVAIPKKEVAIPVLAAKTSLWSWMREGVRDMCHPVEKTFFRGVLAHVGGVLDGAMFVGEKVAAVAQWMVGGGARVPVTVTAKP